jgi:hypothetical protein
MAAATRAVRGNDLHPHALLHEHQVAGTDQIGNQQALSGVIRSPGVIRAAVMALRGQT